MLKIRLKGGKGIRELGSPQGVRRYNVCWRTKIQRQTIEYNGGKVKLILGVGTKVFDFEEVLLEKENGGEERFVIPVIGQRPQEKNVSHGGHPREHERRRGLRGGRGVDGCGLIGEGICYGANLRADGFKKEYNVGSFK